MTLQVKAIEGTNLVLFQNFRPKYNIGDIVVLKSGSPDMTVVGCDTQKVEVNWYNDLQLHGACYPLNAVKAKRVKNVASV